MNSSPQSSSSTSEVWIYLLIAIGAISAAFTWFRHGGLTRLEHRLRQGVMHLPWWTDAIAGLLLMGLPMAWAALWLSERQRRANAMTHVHIQQGPDDMADPVQVTGLWDSLADALRPRYMAWLVGTPTLTFSVERMGPDQPIVFALSCPTRWVPTVTGLLQSTYPHVRVEPAERCLPTSEMTYQTQMTDPPEWVGPTLVLAAGLYGPRFRNGRVRVGWDGRNRHLAIGARSLATPGD